MARKKGTRPAVAARWEERVARQRRSGLSVAEFCRRERVHPVSFYNWRRRLEGVTQRGRGGSRISRAFLPLELVAEESAPAGARSPQMCELVLGSLVCRVPRELDEDGLRHLVRVLLQEASRC
jgi:hypothetical protein